MNISTRKGFTIIELLVVVAIIVILTGIVITNLSQSQLKSRDGKRVSDLSQLQLALDLYFDRCNQYPQLGSNFLMDTTANNGCPSGIEFSLFLGKIPTPPKAGDYIYAVNNITTPTDYILRAQLEGNNHATRDDIDGQINSSGTTYYYATSASVPGSSVSNATLSCDDPMFCIQPR